MESFLCESMVRGYHVYKDIWDAVKEQILDCQREPSNRHEPFAVSVVQNATVVGHLPRKISTICSLFLQGNGSISCRVAGGRRYSRDLPQGGLEIPCVLTFTGSSPLLDKTEKLLKEVTTLAGKTDKENKQPPSADTNPPNKKVKVDDEWIREGRVCLKMSERQMVSRDKLCPDHHATPVSSSR